MTQWIAIKDQLPIEQVFNSVFIVTMYSVCCLLYETTEETSHAAAFMADNLIKYLQVIRRGHNILSAASDYNAYEEEVYQAKLARERNAELN